MNEFFYLMLNNHIRIINSYDHFYALIFIYYYITRLILS